MPTVPWRCWLRPNVLVVNPLRDRMELVAESPAVNDRRAVMIL